MIALQEFDLSANDTGKAQKSVMEDHSERTRSSNAGTQTIAGKPEFKVLVLSISKI